MKIFLHMLILLAVFVFVFVVIRFCLFSLSMKQKISVKPKISSTVVMPYNSSFMSYPVGLEKM